MGERIEDGGPAAPVAGLNEQGQLVMLHNGMSLRDWFAGQIASGMAAYSGTSGISYSPGEIAGRSYEVADAMLQAREKRP